MRHAPAVNVVRIETERQYKNVWKFKIIVFDYTPLSVLSNLRN